MVKSLFIFIGGSDAQNGDYSRVRRYAASPSKTATWSSLKSVRPGDRVLIYIRQPPGALVVEAEVLSEPHKGKPGDWAYLALLGHFRLLPNRVDLNTLKKTFPHWAWLRYPRRGIRVPPDISERLWTLCHTRPLQGAQSEPARITMKTGAGFGDAEENAQVERAAVLAVTAHLERRGYSVRSRESEKIGYDLEAKRGRKSLHVEVKGVTGAEVRFQITPAEVRRAQTDPLYWIAVVTEATTKCASIHTYRGMDLKTSFELTPLGFMATRLS